MIDLTTTSKLECRYADSENCFGTVAHRIFGTSATAHGEVCDTHRNECEAAGTFTILDIHDWQEVTTAKLRVSNSATVTHLLWPWHKDHVWPNYESYCGLGEVNDERHNGKPLSDYRVDSMMLDTRKGATPAGVCKACYRAW